MQDQVEDQTLRLISEFYPSFNYTPAPSQGGEQPKRRRRRKNKGEGSESCLKKRKLSQEQVEMLEMSFGCEHKLESERKDRLASELGLGPRQIAVWFQNRRARWKNKKLEEEFAKLRNHHESLFLHKSRLETEVLSLKEKLNEAKMEIQRLVERSTSSTADNVSSNSSSSSLTVDHQPNNHSTNDNNNNNNVMDAELIGDQFGMGCFFDNMLYMATNTNDYVPCIESWGLNLYDISPLDYH